MENKITEPSSINNPETSKASPIPTSESESLGVLEEKIKKLEKKAESTETNFDRLEKNVGNMSNLMMWITSVIAGIFAITTIFIALDYWKYNEERYEKFVDKTQDFYTKEETIKLIIDFKNCIWFNGLSN